MARGQKVFDGTVDQARAAAPRRLLLEGALTSAVVTAVRPPKVLPTKEMKPPVDGRTLENSESVLPRNRIATPARMMVRGDANPAV